MCHVQWRIKRSGGPGARYSVGPSARPLQSTCRDETPDSYYILDLIEYDLITVLLVPYGQFTGHNSQSHQWPDEMTQFACMLRIEDTQRECYSDSSASKELGMLRLIAQTFPNVEVVLRLYLCMMICNYSGERTFSRLKLIKSALRSTIRQQRLNCLAFMSIECDVLRIDEFSRRKAQKVAISI